MLWAGLHKNNKIKYSPTKCFWWLLFCSGIPLNYYFNLAWGTCLVRIAFMRIFIVVGNYDSNVQWSGVSLGPHLIMRVFQFSRVLLSSWQYSRSYLPMPNFPCCALGCDSAVAVMRVLLRQLTKSTGRSTQLARRVWYLPAIRRSQMPFSAPIFIKQLQVR